MKPLVAGLGSQEIELKLALPTSDPSTLKRRLGRLPVLARRKGTALQLHNIYFDTPELLLRSQRVALRLRRVGDSEKPQWLQTLKTSAQGNSALSLRGEWEMPVANASLSAAALQDTPWRRIDTQGTLFQALAPIFETNFERTLWLLRRRDGSVLELALDVGHIVTGGKSTPICELELELKAGQPAALFELALQIADSIALLPAASSKAERGYALAAGAINSALHARPQPLPPRIPLPAIAQRVLRETFSQFTTNLNTLLVSDDAEVVHQARVGWRRFKSASRFFRPVLAAEALPSWQPLQTLLTCLGRLRDLDVARSETLPPLAPAFIEQDTHRADLWQGMTLALEQTADLQRKAIRYALQEASVGACLLKTTQWLESLTDPVSAQAPVLKAKPSPRRWTRSRIKRLRQQLKLASRNIDQPEQKHRVRILAKRLRYNVEALQSLLPGNQAQRWQQQASDVQTQLGMMRDAMRSATLVAELELDRGLAEFVRGFAAAQQTLR